MKIFKVLQQSLQLSRCRGYVIGDRGYLTDDDLFVYSVRAARAVAFPACAASIGEFMAAVKGAVCMSYNGKFVDDLRCAPFDWMSDHQLMLSHPAEVAVLNSDFVQDCCATEVTLFHKAGDDDAVGVVIENESELLFGVFSKKFMEDFYVSERD